MGHLFLSQDYLQWDVDTIISIIIYSRKTWVYSAVLAHCLVQLNLQSPTGVQHQAKAGLFPLGNYDKLIELMEYNMYVTLSRVHFLAGS